MILGKYFGLKSEFLPFCRPENYPNNHNWSSNIYKGQLDVRGGLKPLKSSDLDTSRPLQHHAVLTQWYDMISNNSDNRDLYGANHFDYFTMIEEIFEIWPAQMLQIASKLHDTSLMLQIIRFLSTGNFILCLSFFKI